MLRISSIAKRLLASEEGFGSRELMFELVHFWEISKGGQVLSSAERDELSTNATS
jgi:hypothetical protein